MKLKNYILSITMILALVLAIQAAFGKPAFGSRPMDRMEVQYKLLPLVPLGIYLRGLKRKVSTAPQITARLGYKPV